LRSNSDEVEKNNDCFAIYTSPPPTAEPEGELLTGKRDHPGVLLKEKPLKGLHLNLICRNINMSNVVEFKKASDRSPACGREIKEAILLFQKLQHKCCNFLYNKK